MYVCPHADCPHDPCPDEVWIDEDREEPERPGTLTATFLINPDGSSVITHADGHTTFHVAP